MHCLWEGKEFTSKAASQPISICFSFTSETMIFHLLRSLSHLVLSRVIPIAKYGERKLQEFRQLYPEYNCKEPPRLMTVYASRLLFVFYWLGIKHRSEESWCCTKTSSQHIGILLWSFAIQLAFILQQVFQLQSGVLLLRRLLFGLVLSSNLQ